MKVKTSSHRKFGLGAEGQNSDFVSQRTQQPFKFQPNFNQHTSNSSVKKVDRYSDVWNLLSMLDVNQGRNFECVEVVKVEENPCEDYSGITSLLVKTHLCDK